MSAASSVVAPDADGVDGAAGRAGADGPTAVAPDRVALGFVDVLRRAGVPVPLGDSIVYLDALARLGMEERRTVYWAGRVTLVKRQADLAAYDVAFATYWDEGRPGIDVVRAELDPQPEDEPDDPEDDDDDAGDGADAAEPPVLAVDDDLAEAPGDAAEASEPAEDTDDDGVAGVRASAAERLRGKDFAAYTEAELDDARRAMAALPLVVPSRRSRRRRPVPRPAAGSRVDLRRSVRAALRTDGELVARPATVATRRPRRLVLLLDVSGSMEPYARALLRFAQSAAGSSSGVPVEVFTLGTRLTRVSKELAHHDPDQALARAAQSVDDWSGGTRLGESLRRFNDEWGVRGLARGATVVIASDGWERGDPSVLGEQMARLARVAQRIVWVNPLKASPGYQPLARGMAAALPHVDRFVEGHSLDAVADLIAVLGDEPSGVRRRRPDVRRADPAGTPLAPRLDASLGLPSDGPRAAALPDPQVPDPRAPDPRVPDPRVPDPQAPGGAR